VTQTNVWDDAAESYRALYGDPDVVTPHLQAADAQSMASFKVRLEQIQAARQTELAGMLKVLVAQERTIQRLQNELHAVTAQVVTMEERVKELEIQEERITQLEGASYSANEYLERMEAKMQAWEADS
jgi:predicted RNase H-like nuclease (RuvC/YqgF family)